MRLKYRARLLLKNSTNKKESGHDVVRFFRIRTVNKMTIIEAINKIDTLKPNNYTQPEKTLWLSTIDGIIKKEIIDTHEGSEDVIFNKYDVDTALDTVLLVPFPYDDIYIKWLEAQIDYANGETPKYNNSMTMYNTAYYAFQRYYNRTHMPKGKSIKFF
jgi:hypothetical protein